MNRRPAPGRTVQDSRAEGPAPTGRGWALDRGPAGATDPSARRLGVVAVVILFGYLVLGRAFAQIGVGAANVFLGEVLLVGAVVHRRTRAGLVGAVRAVSLPNELHVLAWSTLLFVGYGIVQVGRSVLVHAPLIEALKVFAFNYYPAFLFIGIAVGLVAPDVIERVGRTVPWGVAAFLGVSAAGINVSLPFSAAVGLYAGAGAPVCILLMICFERRLTDRLPAFAMCVLSWLYFQIRGDWLGVIGAIGLWAVVTRKIRALLWGVLACTLTFAVIDALDLRIAASQYRGGSISAGEIFGRLVAPFNEDLGRRFARDAEVFAGTAEWRRDFWRAIWAEVNRSESGQLFGLGYGRPLSGLTTFIGEDLRTPHNVFFFALGYGGWLGVAFFALFHASVFAALWTAFRRTGNPFGILLWTFATLTGLFGNFFETPYNALPYYTLLGLCLAPLARRTPEVFGADQPVRGRRATR